ncbi:MAG: DUF2130 domain-containing protein [Chitinophagales bacterium]
MSENKIKCPNCGTLIDIDEVLNHQAEERLKEKMRLKENELLAKEKEFEEKRIRALEEYKVKLEADRQRIAKEEAEKANQKVKEEFELSIKKLEEENAARKEENQALKNQRLELLKKEEALEEDRKHFELKLLEQKKALKEELELKIKQEKDSEIELLRKEFKLREEQQAKLIDEMKRKAEQGSMQLQGESMELALEGLLKEAFPFDLIEEVGKGVRGADCIQTVRNNFGQPCGKIIYESKRTQAFSNEWIEKLKSDMRAQNADIAIIVTQTMPKDMEQFGEKNGIWICTYQEVRALAHVLRGSILKVFAVSKSQENKGDKMHLLYDYLTSNEFGEQWKAVREGFLAMRHSIDTERSQMEKLWKAREKQLDKILLNASHISGSIEGIAGMENIDIKLIEE